MISRDSILRRLPADNDVPMLIVMDGIRHAGEIAGLAYGRLLGTLTDIALNEYVGDAIGDRYTSAFLDAWSVVDAIDRFRALWELLPRAPDAVNPPGVQPFREVAEPVRNLRNVADHLAQRLEYVVACKGTALGSLSWLTLRGDSMKGVICTVVPGTLRKSQAPVVNPFGREMERPTGLVQLAAGEYQANLSSVMREMALRIRHVEEMAELAIRKAGLEGKQAGADAIVKLEVSFDVPENAKAQQSDQRPN